MALEVAKRREGRPRSEAAHRAVIEATKTLLCDINIRDLTIEKIAKESGVGKPTIYRWWHNKTAIVMDAFLESVSLDVEYPKRDTILESLKAQLHQVLRLVRGAEGRLIAEILAEGQSDPNALESFRERFLLIRRAA